MKRWQIKPRHYVLAAAISFLIAVIIFSGLVSRGNVPGRLIFGTVWSVVSIGCVSRYYHVRLKAREQEVYELRESLLAQTRDTAIQQERNRLARELHDSIKQQVFSISMSAAAVQARWETDPQGAREALGDVQRSAQEAMVEMNALLQQLSPAPLEKVGLVQALHDQCEALGYRTGAEVAVEFGALPADDLLPRGAQESVFRIVQEAFSNIARHARAGNVRLYVGQRGTHNALTLEIVDDGQGFDPHSVEGGMGLDSIRQRVQALDGDMIVESAPAEGTRIHVTVPLAEPFAFDRETPGHTLNKVFLVGLAGGLALIAALFYPLYRLIPGNYIDGWPAGSRVAGLTFQIVAVSLTVGAGFLAARWIGSSTRQANALWGALAGAVAGIVVYFGIVAPTACLIGSGTLLERGLIPADGRADAIRLLAEAAVGVVWWAHGTFWGTLLFGTGLGAIGGLLLPPVTWPSKQFNLRPVALPILTGLVTVSALSFIVAAFMYGLLEPTIREGLVANDVSLIIPLERIVDRLVGAPMGYHITMDETLDATWLLDSVSDWLVGTPMLFYVTSLIGVYFVLRAEIKTTDDPARLSGMEALAAFLGFVALGVPVCLAAINTTSAQGTVATPNGWMDVSGLYHPSATWVLVSVSPLLLAIGIGGSLVMGGLYLAAMSTVNRRQRTAGLYPPPVVQTIAIISLPLSLGLAAWATRLLYSHTLFDQWMGIALGIGIVVGNVVLIVRLLRVPRQPVSHQAPRIVAAILSVLLSPILISWAVSVPPFDAWIGIVIAIVNIALIINLLRPSKHSFDASAQMRSRTMLSQLVHVGLGAVIAATAPLATIISTQTGMHLISNPLVEVLIGRESAAQEFTLVELARDLYLDQVTAFLTTLLIAIVAIGLLTLVISGMMAISEQFAPGQKPGF